MPAATSIWGFRLSSASGGAGVALVQREIYPSRLTLARMRRQLTIRELADRVRVSYRHLTGIERSGDQQRRGSGEIVERLAMALRFPIGFFYAGDVDLLPTPSQRGRDYTKSPVSYRAHYSIPARARDSSLAAGVIARLIDDEVSARFNLPAVDVPDLSDAEIPPEEAASAVRVEWGLGLRPIRNVVHVLESRGVRVFRLASDLAELDAFSYWFSDRPFVLLNTHKSGERSRFDAAHELGHLVLHRAGDVVGRQAEKEANAFASAFLLPEETFRPDCPNYVTPSRLLLRKPKWKVSVAAMLKRADDLHIYNDWQVRQTWIELSKRGWRRAEPGEPDPLPHEQSLRFKTIGELLAKSGASLDDIRKAQFIPPDDFNELIPPAGDAAPQTPSRARSGRRVGHLRVLK